MERIKDGILSIFDSNQTLFSYLVNRPQPVLIKHENPNLSKIYLDLYNFCLYDEKQKLKSVTMKIEKNEKNKVIFSGRFQTGHKWYLLLTRKFPEQGTLKVNVKDYPLLIKG